MDNHTPGEWRVVTTMGSFGPKRLHIVALPFPDSDELVMVLDAGEADDAECQANARLAVAAKGLYKAALGMRPSSDWSSERRKSDMPVRVPRVHFNALMAAVEKVKGGDNMDGKE